MSELQSAEVIFLRVTDVSTKLNRIVTTVAQHYNAGDRITIFVPNQQAAEYIDALLWRLPPSGFLPHSISDAASSERIVVTQSASNINEATIAFNLMPGPCPDLKTYEKIYELSDQTDSQKAAQSERKIDYYKKLGY